jgi:6-phosphogluconolactonase
LTGGATPQRLYSLLADRRHPWRARIDWTRVHVFWGDERHVPPDHQDSNFGMAHRAMLAHVPIPADHIHRMRGELADPAEAAREYDVTIRAYEPFDVMLLGLGEDAHIASIFPGSSLLSDFPLRPSPDLGAVRLRDTSASRPGGERVAAMWAEHLHAWRITLTPRALVDAVAIVMLVSGDEKAGAVRAALDDPDAITRVPAHLLRAAVDRVEWFIDSAAAGWRAAPPA